MAALTVGVGIAWAGTTGALDLFQSNPQARGAGPKSVWHQQVIPSSVVQAAVVEIPRLGEAQFWYGKARQGGWCGAVRLPDGSWAGTKGSASGGTGPGCYPTREQVNGDHPVFVINGFDYYEVEVDARDVGGSFWRIYYGVVSGDKPPARVVDEVSGRSGRVHNGEAFALAVPNRDPGRSVPRAGGSPHLVAYDSHGRVVADERSPRRG
jgi:hypothetical protein